MPTGQDTGWPRAGDEAPSWWSVQRSRLGRRGASDGECGKRTDGRRRAWSRDAADEEHSRHFTRTLHAQRWLDEVNTSVVTGQYVDPRAGRVTATSCAERADRQVCKKPPPCSPWTWPRTACRSRSPPGELRRSHVEQWVEQMSTRGLAPGTVRPLVMDVRGDACTAAAPEHRRPPVAAGLPPRRCHQGDAARAPPLLRQRADRRRLRPGDRPAGPRARPSDDDPEHLRAPLADRGGPDTSRRRRAAGRSAPDPRGRVRTSRRPQALHVDAECGQREARQRPDLRRRQRNAL